MGIIIIGWFTKPQNCTENEGGVDVLAWIKTVDLRSQCHWKLGEQQLNSLTVCALLFISMSIYPLSGVLGWLLVVVLFAPIRGGSLGICFVCWMLLRHSTEALVYSNHPRAAAASSYLAIIFGRIASGVPWFLRSTAEPMQHPHQC